MTIAEIMLRSYNKVEVTFKYENKDFAETHVFVRDRVREELFNYQSYLDDFECANMRGIEPKIAVELIDTQLRRGEISFGQLDYYFGQRDSKSSRDDAVHINFLFRQKGE